jgi:flagellar hook-associated protein 3 FlgL
VTVDDGVNPAVTADVDLSGAETIGDLKTRLEAAIGAGPPSLTVGLNATNNGLLLTPSGGTVSVVDLDGGTTASQLGIAANAAATITSGDLQPRVTLQTSLADLNGGAGVNLAGGLQITSGSKTVNIDFTGASTVEDVLNAISSQTKAAGIAVVVGLNEDETGIAVAGRTSGSDFSIGENGGTAATELGLRTFTAQTSLSDLNLGVGIPKSEYALEITRRDGTSVSVDLSAASTVQDVLDAINAVDPGVLVASLNATGNGITLLDNDGVSTGPLSVTSNPLSDASGLAGTEAGSDPTVPLVGSDPNPQESQGVFNLLLRLETALRTGDDAELNRLAPKMDVELDRFDQVRADVGTKLQTLEEVDNRLKDRAVTLQESLSSVFDADLAEVLSQVAYRQATLEATLRISAQTMGLNLINYL